MNSNNLNEDEIEIRTNKIRSIMAELLNTSIFTLKEAFESQKLLKSKINLLENTLKPITDLKNLPDFKEGHNKLIKSKNRINQLMNRIILINNRLIEIEKKN